MAHTLSRTTAALLVLLCAFGPLATDMYLASLPVLRTAFATEPERVQLTLSLYVVAFGLAQLVCGPLSDRFGRRPVLIGGTALFSAASLACAAAPDIETLIAARVVQAIGGCAGPVLGRAVVRDLMTPQEGARVLAGIGAAVGFAPAIAPAIGGHLTAAFGWEAVFLVLAGLAAFGCLATALALPETNQRRNPQATRPGRLVANYRAIAADPAWRANTIAMGGTYGGLFVFISGSAPVLQQVHGVPVDAFGYYFGAVALCYVLGSTAAGRLTRRVGIDRLVRGGLIVAAAAGTAQAALTLAGWDDPVSLTAIQAAFVFGFGVVFPNALAGAAAPFPHMAGAASALSGFAMMLAASVIGLAVAAGFDGTALPLGLGLFACGWGGLLLHRAAATRPARHP